MGSTKPEAYSMKAQMTITLLFLFLVFVILDVWSTQWLIINTPGGILNEINPIGVLLYERLGSVGMIFPKFAIFIIFAAMAVYFSLKLSHIKWFVEVTQSLVLVQMAVSLIVIFNNFIAMLATLYVQGLWPVIQIPQSTAVFSIYLADLALGSVFANGLLYMWGLTKRTMHLKVFIGLILFITPVLAFAESFRIHLWLFALYVASASSALGLAFYLTEAKRLRAKRPPEAEPANKPLQ